VGNLYVSYDSEGYANMTYLIDKLLDVIFWLAESVIGILPTYDFPYTNAVSLLATAIATVDQYFPITDLFQIIILYVAYYGLVTWVRPMLKFVRLA